MALRSVTNRKRTEAGAGGRLYWQTPATQAGSPEFGSPALTIPGVVVGVRSSVMSRWGQEDPGSSQPTQPV